MKYLKIGQYRRSIPVGMDRMFENVFDWEHLPHLHKTTFSQIEALTIGRKYFKGLVRLQPSPLRLTQIFTMFGCRRRQHWMVRVKSGFQKGTVIFTKASEISPDAILVHVNFFIPKHRWYFAWFGVLMWMTYKRLYDEDVAMMIARQKALDELQSQKTTKKDQISKLDLGPVTEVESELPLTFQWNQRPFRLVRYQGQLKAFATTCPHLLAKLDESHIKNDEIICPWHGYRFHLDHGRCDQVKHLKLQCPKVELHEGRVMVFFS
jgi:nitrite reductase/ring-hydroxylating ferredoxin subunit